jgi:antitoxin component of MazEF toxin-antitoxin module
MNVNVEVKKWGNSLGFIIPKEAARKLRVNAGDQVVVDIRAKENPLKELFGSVKFKKPTTELLAEARADLDSKW